MRISFNFLGAQGSGKGTQSKALVDYFDFIHFDAGEALRQIMADDSLLGRAIESYLDKGSRVPPRLIANVTYEALAKEPAAKDILFDGLLRGLDELEAQRQTFEKLNLELPVIIFLDLDEAAVIERISKRRICTVCDGREIVTDDHQNCKLCGGKLTIRHDDTPAALAERLSWYYRDTLPVVDYFRKLGKVIDIDARPSVAEISSQVIIEVLAYYKSKNLTAPIRKK